jgi:hypothetical protein
MQPTAKLRRPNDDFSFNDNENSDDKGFDSDGHEDNRAVVVVVYWVDSSRGDFEQPARQRVDCWRVGGRRDYRDSRGYHRGLRHPAPICVSTEGHTVSANVHRRVGRVRHFAIRFAFNR